MWNLPTLRKLGLKSEDKRYKISEEVRQAIKADCSRVPREPFRIIAERYKVSITAVRWINNPDQIRACYKKYTQKHKRPYVQKKEGIYKYREHIRSLMGNEEITK